MAIKACWNCGTELLVAKLPDGFKCPTCNVDVTEHMRKQEIVEINVASTVVNAVAEELGIPPEELARQRLSEQYGQVWNTEEMSRDFVAVGFMAPYVVVRRKSDGKEGTLTFQHSPRFYYDFQEG